MSREFIQLDENGYRLGPYYNTATPSAAAIKAVYKGHTKIFLLEKDTNKLYGYTGKMEILGAVGCTIPQTDFQLKMGITKVPKTKSLGKFRFVEINPDFEWD